MVSKEMMKSIPGVIIFSAIFIMFSMFMLFSVVARDVNIDDLEAGLLMKRLYYSTDCFAYGDERGYPGVIDKSKFNDERLNECLVTDYYIWVKINDVVVRNKDGFEDRKNFCKFEQYNCFFSEQLVLVDDKLEMMEMGVIMENV